MGAEVTEQQTNTPAPEQNGDAPAASAKSGNTMLTQDEPKAPETKEAKDVLYKGEDKKEDSAAPTGADKKDSKSDSGSKDQKPNGEAKKEEATAYDLKLPEGSQLSKAELEEIAAYAREQGFSQEQAQKAVERESKAVSAFVQKQTEALQQKKGQWESDIRADTEVGGIKFEENLTHARKALNRFGSPQLLNELETTGLGNHPEMIRLMARIGKSMASDSFIQAPASQGESKPKSLAERLYPKHYEKKDG